MLINELMTRPSWPDFYNTSAVYSNWNVNCSTTKTATVKPEEIKMKAKNEDKIEVKIQAKSFNLDGENIEMTPEFAEAFEKAYKEAKKKKKNKVVPRPADPIKQVYFNYDKDTTTVIWKDGTVTVIKCDSCDIFDEEKAIALCFMKKFFDNRGCYNSFIEKYINNAEIQ